MIRNITWIFREILMPKDPCHDRFNCRKHGPNNEMMSSASLQLTHRVLE